MPVRPSSQKRLAAATEIGRSSVHGLGTAPDNCARVVRRSKEASVPDIPTAGVAIQFPICRIRPALLDSNTSGGSLWMGWLFWK